MHAVFVRFGGKAFCYRSDDVQCCCVIPYVLQLYSLGHVKQQVLIQRGGGGSGGGGVSPPLGTTENGLFAATGAFFKPL